MKRTQETKLEQKLENCFLIGSVNVFPGQFTRKTSLPIFKNLIIMSLEMALSIFLLKQIKNEGV